MRKRQFLFRLFYSTSFSVFLIVEVLLLLISPGDIIYQSFAADHQLSIVAIAIVYVAVLLISAFIIATRFYTAHTQLTAIPKSHVPIRKDDLKKSLYRLISSEASRSAAIAYHARPQSTSTKEIQALSDDSKTKATIIPWPIDHMKSWTEIQHPGWSSPCAQDLPDLQFEPVLLEFPNLLEAEAMSLASADQLAKLSPENGFADPYLLDLLQRPASMSLRGYLDRLIELEMLDDTAIASDFIQSYERFRFSRVPLSEQDFRRMLGNFTNIMQELRAPSPNALRRYLANEEQLQGLEVQSSNSSPHPVSTPLESAITKKQRRVPFNDNVHEPSSLPSQSSRRFLSAQTHAYQASLSSGHAGDRSSDSENDFSRQTAYRRPARQSRGNTQPDFTSAQAPAGVINDADRIEDERRPLSTTDDDGNAPEDGDGGSIIRRSVTNRTSQSTSSSTSRRSLGSVIWREDQGESTLPLPMVNDTGLGIHG